VEDKIKIHEQLFELLKDNYITREEYLISLKDNIFSLEDKIIIQEKLNDLLQNDYITKDEHLVLINESLTSTETSKVIDEPNEIEETPFLEKNIIKQLKSVGSYVHNIYYLIVFEIIISIIYESFLDVKIEYFYKNNGIPYNSSDLNPISKLILNSNNIDKIVKNLEHLNEIYYLIQFVLFSMFLSFLWNIGDILKNVNREI
jgi:hypothetical protein